MAATAQQVETPPEPSVVIGADLDSPPGSDVSRETSTTLPPADPTLEQRARSVGWKPQAEFEGAPEKWKPAEEFLAVHDGLLSTWRNENKELRKQLAELRQQTEALSRERQENATRAEQIRLDGLRYERQQALENQDHRRVNEIDTELMQAAAATEVRKAAPAPPVDAQAGVRIWNEYAARPGNEWMNADPVLARAMIKEMKAIRDVDPALPPFDLLEEAKDYVQRTFPEKFDRRNRAPLAAGMTEMRGTNGAHRGNVKTWNDLVPEAKAQFERMIDNNPKLTKAGILQHCAANPSLYFRS